MSGLSNAQLAAQVSDLLTRWNAREDQVQEWLGGTADGGPEGDGRYPLSDARGVTQLVPCPARLADDASGPAAEASGHRNGAEQARDVATAMADRAEAQRVLVDGAKVAVYAARDLTLQYRDRAANAEANAEVHRQYAEQARLGTASDLIGTAANRDDAEYASAWAFNYMEDAQDAAERAGNYDPALYATRADGLSQIVGLQSALDARLLTSGFTWAALPGKPSTFTPTNHRHSWSELDGVPTTFTPANHGHAISEVSGLQAALDAKTAAGSFPTFSQLRSSYGAGGVAGTVYFGNGDKYLDYNGYNYSLVGGALYVSGQIFQNGHAVWTPQNFDPASKAAAVHSHDWAQVTGKPSLVLHNENATLAAVYANRLVANNAVTHSFFHVDTDEAAFAGTSPFGNGVLSDCLAFKPVNKIDYTTDGVTYTNRAATDANPILRGKANRMWGGFGISPGTLKTRIWLYGSYTFVEGIVATHSTNGNYARIIFEASEDNVNFTEVFKTDWFSSWPGYTWHRQQANSGSKYWWRIVIETDFRTSNSITFGHLGMPSGYGSTDYLFDWNHDKSVDFTTAIRVNGNVVFHGGNLWPVDMQTPQDIGVRKRFTASPAVGGFDTQSYVNSAVEVWAPASDRAAFMSFHIAGIVGNKFGLDLDGWLKTDAHGLTIQGSKVLTAVSGGDVLFNNGGIAHGSTPAGFGGRFFYSTGPNASQAYGLTLGLGANYAADNYSISLAVPRQGYAGEGYLHYRNTEAGVVGAWTKIKAGQADSLAGRVNAGQDAPFVTGGNIWTVGFNLGIGTTGNQNILFFQNNNLLARIDSTGLSSFVGLYNNGSRVPVFTSSTGGPSGGTDGDIHVTY